MSPLETALADLLLVTLPFRDGLKGDLRARFMAEWIAASDALNKGRFKGDEEPLKDPRRAAVQMFGQALTACAALGVKPHELVPLFNERAEGGLAGGSAEEALVLLARAAIRTARAVHEPKKEDAA